MIITKYEPLTPSGYRDYRNPNRLDGFHKNHHQLHTIYLEFSFKLIIFVDFSEIFIDPIWISIISVTTGS